MSETQGEIAPSQYRGLCPPWQKGQSGNPKGKPKGSRTKLCEDFLADMQTAWETEGIGVIERVIEEKPADFLKVVASLLPKEFNLNANIFSDFGEDDLGALLTALEAIQSGRLDTAGEGRTIEGAEYHETLQHLPGNGASP